MATATKRKSEPKIDAGYYTAEEAAALLRISAKTMPTYARYFTDPRPIDKRGKGSERKYLRAEVNIAATEGFDALAEFRARLGRRN